MKNGVCGFTLIELLIVVAIIGILAAIAVPNFLNAKMRAKVAKMEADMKALGDALLMYRIDNKCYFSQMGSNPQAELRLLTSPIPYIGSVPQDPFRHATYAKYKSTTLNYDYSSYPMLNVCKTHWLLHGIGPDGDEDSIVADLAPNRGSDKFKTRLYQLSNGVSSSGDVIHTSWSGLSF